MRSSYRLVDPIMDSPDAGQFPLLLAHRVIEHTSIPDGSVSPNSPFYGNYLPRGVIDGRSETAPATSTPHHDERAES